MLPKRFRLSRREGMGRYSRKIVSPYFIVHIRPNSLAHNRYAIVVGVRAARRAVMRHALRRRIANIARRVRGWGNDVVIIATPPITTLSMSELERECEHVIRRITEHDAHSHQRTT